MDVHADDHSKDHDVEETFDRVVNVMAPSCRWTLPLHLRDEHFVGLLLIRHPARRPRCVCGWRC